MAHHQSRRTGVVVLLALALAVPVTAGPSQAVRPSPEPNGSRRRGSGPAPPASGTRTSRGRQRRLRRQALPAWTCATSPATDRLPASRRSRRGPRRTCPGSTSTWTACTCGRSASTGTGRPGRGTPASCTIDPGAGPAERPGVPDRGAVRRRTAADYVTEPRATRLLRHRRRGRGRGAAARRLDLVPGQRPPDRQGRLHVPDHRARGPQVVANGARRQRRQPRPLDRPGRGRPASRWRPTSPPSRSASSSEHHRRRGISYWDAIDPDLFTPSPRRGPAGSWRSASRPTPPTSG